MQKICRVKDFQILWGEDQIFRSKNPQNKTKKKRGEQKRISTNPNSEGFSIGRHGFSKLLRKEAFRIGLPNIVLGSNGLCSHTELQPKLVINLNKNSINIHTLPNYNQYTRGSWTAFTIYTYIQSAHW